MTAERRLGWFLKDTGLGDYVAARARGALEGQPPTALRQYSIAFNEDATRGVFKAEVDPFLGSVASLRGGGHAL